jgi:DNA-binding transcriptional MerR regulator
MEVLDVAKRAGFSLDEARILLQKTEAGSPAFEALRDLAARKLPEVEALIDRAQAPGTPAQARAGRSDRPVGEQRR